MAQAKKKPRGWQRRRILEDGRGEKKAWRMVEAKKKPGGWQRRKKSLEDGRGEEVWRILVGALGAAKSMSGAGVEATLRVHNWLDRNPDGPCMFLTGVFVVGAIDPVSVSVAEAKKKPGGWQRRRSLEDGKGEEKA
jgi:hypothetical protein